MIPIRQISSLIVLLGAVLLAPNAHSTIIHESATLGTTGQSGGLSLSSQFLGSRFSLTETQTITGIGGHIWTQFGSIWGAIIELDTSTSNPSFAPGNIEANALAFALFESNSGSQDLLESVNVTLGAGDYALVFGNNFFFGSTGSGAMPGGDSDLPGASYFYSNGSSWTNGGFSNVRFVVEGVTGVPSPGTLALFAFALLGLFTQRKLRTNI